MELPIFFVLSMKIALGNCHVDPKHNRWRTFERRLTHAFAKFLFGPICKHSRINVRLQNIAFGRICRRKIVKARLKCKLIE